MEQRALPVVLVLLVVSAGCSGFAGSGADGSASGGANTNEGGADPSVSVTPAPVPTTEGTPTPGPRIAPGLATTGVENASALAAAHEQVLADTSVTIRRVTTYRYGSGEIARREIVTTRIGPNGSRLRVTEEGEVGASSARETASGTDGSSEEGIVREAYWFGANRSVRAITYANGTTRYGTNPPKNLTRSRRAIIRTEATRLDALASGFETRVSRIGNGSEKRYRVTSVRESEGGDRIVQVGFVPVSSFSLVVGPRGVAEQYRLVRRLSVQRRGKPTEIVTRVRYANIGETSAERPPWYEKAVETSNARTTNASALPRNRAR